MTSCIILYLYLSLSFLLQFLFLSWDFHPLTLTSHHFTAYRSSLGFTSSSSQLDNHYSRFQFTPSLPVALQNTALIWMQMSPTLTPKLLSTAKATIKSWGLLPLESHHLQNLLGLQHCSAILLDVLRSLPLEQQLLKTMLLSSLSYLLSAENKAQQKEIPTLGLPQILPNPSASSHPLSPIR